MIKLGVKVKDKISGLVGTTVLRTEYLNGCIQYGVQAPLKKKDGEITTWNIDENQLEALGKPRSFKKSRNGGPTQKVINQRGTHAL